MYRTKNIKDTTDYSTSLEGLTGKRFKKDEKYPSCMVGKRTNSNTASRAGKYG
jgi:hypothetical protein